VSSDKEFHIPQLCSVFHVLFQLYIELVEVRTAPVENLRYCVNT